MIDVTAHDADEAAVLAAALADGSLSAALAGLELTAWHDQDQIGTCPAAQTPGLPVPSGRHRMTAPPPEPPQPVTCPPSPAGAR